MREKKEEKVENFLKELCGDDVKLYNFLSNYLYIDPLAAISKKDLDILTEEAEKIGNYRPAIDKAIFEAAQNSGERERYIKVIHNLSSKTINATEQEKEMAEKEGLTDQAASLGSIIENGKFMSERAEDIVNVASDYYNEKFVEQGENARRITRGEEKRKAEREEKEIVDREKAGREDRKNERREMGRKERRESKKQDKKEALAAGERKEARKEEIKKVEIEEKRIESWEKAGREERKNERRGN